MFINRSFNFIIFYNLTEIIRSGYLIYNRIDVFREKNWLACQIYGYVIYGNNQNYSIYFSNNTENNFSKLFFQEKILPFMKWILSLFCMCCYSIQINE